MNASPRIFVYEKGEATDEELWKGLPLVEGRDSITRLPNWGREGATYLRHILTLYNSTSSSPSSGAGFADLTLFLQAHLAWDFVAKRRLDSIVPSRTGFISLGPYRENICGFEPWTNQSYFGVERVRAMVKGGNLGECGVVTTTWAGQFAVSRERILANEEGVYRKIDELLEAPDDDPIHQEWGPNGSGGRT
ncbi:hypothetical protein MNV49_005979 [Pseudohyphozyma bogoriensis]|nr:hypothetical protein MNV49_005979 [Pseudohyphozyma bogoriensis]